MCKFGHIRLLLLFTVITFLCSCKNTAKPIKVRKEPLDLPQIKYTVVSTLPHDTNSFTEGLLFHDNKLYESTGSPIEFSQTKSVFGVIDPHTGKIDKKVELDRNIYFGEGIVFLNNKVYQLTYKKQVCFVYNATTFKKIREFPYQNKEGWALTTDGKYIIMSDGTNVISFRNPTDFEVAKTINVSANNFAIDYINELEYIDGFIYANVWPSNIVVKIDPANGNIVGKLDLTKLHDMASVITENIYETNGIAYDSISDKIYVTGKMWPKIYQIDFPH